MPSVIVVDVGLGEMRFWNVNVRVGAGGITRGLDVSLGQWLLCVVGKTSPKLTSSDVIGIWGPKSTAALAHIEQTHRRLLTSDGCIDPIRPGQQRGAISRKVYKMIVFQLTYLQMVTDQSNLLDAVLTGEIQLKTLEERLMSMPEDSGNMPADLKFGMINTRDGGTLEF